MMQIVKLIGNKFSHRPSRVTSSGFWSAGKFLCCLMGNMVTDVMSGMLACGYYWTISYFPGPSSPRREHARFNLGCMIRTQHCTPIFDSQCRGLAPFLDCFRTITYLIIFSDGASDYWSKFNFERLWILARRYGLWGVHVRMEAELGKCTHSLSLSLSLSPPPRP
jgi:hypothetical protein